MTATHDHAAMPVPEPVPSGPWLANGLFLGFRDLRYRSRRFVVSIGATSVVFALLFLMTGLSEQWVREPRLSTAHMQADTWIVPEGISGGFTSNVTIPESMMDEVVVAPGGRVAPFVNARHALDRPSGAELIMLIGFEGDGPGSPQLIEGELPGRGQIVVDRSAGFSVGDEVNLGTYELEVTGLTKDTTVFAGVPLVFVNLDDVQAGLFGGEPLVTSFLVQGEVVELPAGLEAISPQEVSDDAGRVLGRAGSSVAFIQGLLWIVAAMIIGSIVYLSALERRRDVAVLKAVGSDSRTLLTGLVAQALIVALLASLIASGLQTLLKPLVEMQLYVPPRAFWQIPVLNAAVAVLASFVGLRQLAKVEPALAFSSER